MPLHPDGDHAGGGGGAAGGAAGGRGARGGGARPSAQARGGRGQGRGCTVCTGPDLVTQLRIVGWLLIRRVRVFRPLFVELGLLLFAARSAPANALGARRFLLASLLAVPFPVGARFKTQLNGTHDGTAANSLGACLRAQQCVPCRAVGAGTAARRKLP